jgi:hypothetical protein
MDAVGRSRVASKLRKSSRGEHLTFARTTQGAAKSIRLIDSFRLGTTKRERRTETGSLKDEGNQPFHAPLIRSVLVGKLLEHEFLLVAQFDPNAHEY